MSTIAPASTLRALAVKEIRDYARSWLFLLGLAGTVALTAMGFADDDGTSSTMNMIVPAALLGLVGMIVMAVLTARSDRAALAAGTTAVGERARTLALLAATVVPLAAALAWYAAVLVQFHVQPPSAGAVPFGPVGEGHIVTIMFALGVVPAVGGPILGLLVARWLPWRGSSAIAVVLTVIVTIVMQGNFESTWRWHVVWPWTYWYGPLGWRQTGDGPAHWVALPGSPGWWVVYLAALCVLGALVAVYHDPESNRAPLRVAAVAGALACVVAVVLTMTTGLPEAVVNPVPSVSF